jgi:hypothetical protein
MLQDAFDAAREALRNCLADLKVASEAWRQAQTRQAKVAIEVACNKMRPHIITLSPDMREARENFEFFDLLASSCVRNFEAITAMAEKLIGPGLIHQNNDRPLGRDAPSRPSGGGEKEPIPNGFGEQLLGAMKSRAHGYEKACSHMEGMDPKTLRKMLKEEGTVHRSTLSRASEYIRKTPK